MRPFYSVLNLIPTGRYGSAMGVLFGRDYLMTILETRDGRMITGIINVHGQEPVAYLAGPTQVAAETAIDKLWEIYRTCSEGK